MNEAGGMSKQPVRGLTRAVSAAVLVVTVVSAVQVIDQSNLVPSWWTPAALAVFLCSAGSMLVASWNTDAAIRKAILIFAALCPLAAASWLVLWDGVTTQGHIPTWLSTLAGIGCLGAAIVCRPITITAYILLVVPLGQWQDYLAYGGKQSTHLLLNVTFGVAISAFLAATCYLAASASKIAAARAANDAEPARVASWRDDERRSLDEFIHDHVMSTLLAAARSVAPDVVAAHASDALNRFDDLHAANPSPDTISADTLVDALRVTATKFNDQVEVTVELGTGAERLAVPAEVAEALGAGVSEALRNVARHASAQRCGVSVVADSSTVVVEVVDDGVGFDPAAVPSTRLGLALSITARLDELDGGWSTIASSPGHGAQIVMGWRAKPVTRAPKVRLNSNIVDTSRSSVGIAALFLPRTPLRTRCAAPIAAAVPLVAWLGYSSFADAMFASEQRWFFDTVTLVLVILCVHGAIVWAWAGAAVWAALAAMGTSHAGEGAMLGLMLAIVDLAPLLVASVVGHMAFSAFNPRSLVAAQERDSEIGKLEALTRPLLERIATGERLSAEERAQCELLEARLRDQLRGGLIINGAVAEAAMAARRRGVDVTMIDDGGLRNASDDVQRAVRGAVLSALEFATSGSVYARVLPPGRARVAGVLITEGTEEYEIEVGPDGAVTSEVP